MMNLITVQFDFVSDESRAYQEVENAIRNGVNDIHTCCTNFFNFGMLDKGYDVKVMKRSGEYILLSELLKNEDFKYTRRIMRKGHNVERLLLTGEFNWRKPLLD